MREGSRRPPGAAPLEPTFGDLVVESYEGARDAAGRFAGRGRATFAGGACSYEGSFSNGVMHGEGKYTWASGTVYEGAFVANEPRVSIGATIDPAEVIAIAASMQARGRHLLSSGSPLKAIPHLALAVQVWVTRGFVQGSCLSFSLTVV